MDIINEASTHPARSRSEIASAQTERSVGSPESGSGKEGERGMQRRYAFPSPGRGITASDSIRQDDGGVADKGRDIDEKESQ